MTAIAAQPYDYELPTESKIALVIIDMQRDFLEHGGFGDAWVTMSRSSKALCQQLRVS